ncbi:cupin domain-containing protein [Acuticoccus sp. MNP-M23]|uniref:cupin domain-containing protein n=1 Tax=Acuticoccus sp. MNP-M23 TaxID=3072793 RepID=UPI00281673A7|nr:cupin domain-containing protein [Acuticoccus sp. MNP-M23]WMS44044.1 cupin domain-containing protein [Acuticoccus sp. MNP-M23]
MSERRGTLLRRAAWEKPGESWRGHVEGLTLGTNVTVLFHASEPGGGAPLHVHPYDEIFIVREGRVRYTVGDDTIDAKAGDIVLGPANVPHKFTNMGPGRLETTDIHLSDRWIQQNLDDPGDRRDAENDPA